MAQYITHPLQTMAFVPYGDLTDNETKINKKWAIQLALLKKAWERGHTDIYASKRLSPEPEFVLTNDNFNVHPMNKDGSKKPIQNGTELSYKLLSVEELVSMLKRLTTIQPMTWFSLLLYIYILNIFYCLLFNI